MGSPKSVLGVHWASLGLLLKAFWGSMGSLGDPLEVTCGRWAMMMMMTLMMMMMMLVMMMMIVIVMMMMMLRQSLPCPLRIVSPACALAEPGADRQIVAGVRRRGNMV